MHHEQFIAQLATRLGLPQLKFNEEYVCRLILDDQYVIDLEWVEQDAAVHAYAVLNSRASELHPRFAELLAANLFCRATHGAVLALDRARDEILLIRRFTLEHLDMEWFVRQLESLVDSVATWSQRLDERHSHQKNEDDEDSSLSDHVASGLLRV